MVGMRATINSMHIERQSNLRAKVNCQRSEHYRRWRRPYNVDVYHRRRSQIVSISESYGGDLIIHRGVEAGGQKGRGSDDESRGAQLPKSKASARKEVDLEECHSVAEADLPIAKKGT
ncbi:hypothetical protein GW17_00048723 [Ensete ventricosum]|nr:hypothetical protein GW17_00048723 [Ensete ventricosum]